MGIETIAMAAFSAISAASTMQQGKAQAKAIARKGTLDAKNKAKETVYRAANLRQSFLSGGLSMEGTPMSVINETITTGQEDVDQIIANANMSSKNTMSSARSSALGKLGKTFASSLGSFDIGGGIPDELQDFGGNLADNFEDTYAGSEFGFEDAMYGFGG